MLPFTPLVPPRDDTLVKLFRSAVATFERRPALAVRDDDGRWPAISYEEVAAAVRRAARALHDLGVQAGDRVALVAENRPEWAIADYAILSLGAVTVPLYPTLPAGQIAPILRDAGVRVVLASTADQLAKVRTAAASAPEIEHVAGFDPVPNDGAAVDVERRVDESVDRHVEDGDASAAVEGSVDAAVESSVRPDAPPRTLHDWRAMLDRASVAADTPAWGAELDLRADVIGRDDVATIIYTSGTTGVPKGVVLTHYNLAAMVDATQQSRSIALAAGETTLSLLTLSHVFQRVADFLFFSRGVTIHYAVSQQTVPRDLGEVRPHHVIGAPRLYEKIHHAVITQPGTKGRLARWAARVGSSAVEARLAGRPVPAGTRLQAALADRLVFSRLRARVGGRLRTFISGSAPLAAEVAALFHAAGMPIYEGYGLTETSPVLTSNRPEAVRLGTVGIPYPGVELRLGPEREIQARGPSVTRGYWHNQEATRAAFTDDGWFRTGDIGTVEDGFLRITDRLKDLIVTAGGKNVAPQPLEQRVTTSAYIAQAVLVGDRRPYLVMLLVPDFDALTDWARAHGLDPAARHAVASDPRLVAMLESEARARLSDAARHEMPKKFAVLDTELTVDNGLLTPTLKVKRRAVGGRFAGVIEGLY